MVHGGQLFFALFNNLAIFIALVAVYGYLLAHISRKGWFSRQLILGLSFGLFAISCMYAKIPVFEGVIVDQRNAIVALSGVFGGIFSALISAVMVGSFRYYLGGNGALAGVIGVGLATLAGIGLHKLFDRFKSPVNPVAEKILGCRGEECIGKSVFHFIHPEDVEKTENWINACVEQKIPQTSIEIRCVNQKTGASSYLLWSSTFRFNDFGELIETSNIAHDFTAQKMAEESIKESELRYRTLFEYVPDGILITDKSGHCLDANPAMYQMMGAARGDLSSLNTANVITHQEIKKCFRWMDLHR